MAFNTLNRHFVTAPILRHPDPGQPFVVEVDASDIGVGAILSQRSVEDERLHPCAFFSRRLTSSERNYAVGDRELLAVKLALEEWRHWLEGAEHPFQVTKAGGNCGEIHIVFDTYRDDSIKHGERERRGKSKNMVVLDVISPNQNVPVVLENFWSSPISKTAFQAFYAEWLTTNYKGTKPLYLGISPQAWIVSAASASPFPRLNCTHEEADDRMMFHVQDILSHCTGST